MRLVALSSATLALAAVLVVRWASEADRGEPDDADPAADTTSTTTTVTTTTTTTTTTDNYYHDHNHPRSRLSRGGWIRRLRARGGATRWRACSRSVGNPTRTYYGKGPVPRVPEKAWHFPRGDPMCSLSSIGGELREWCGTGWTGQPAVFERDGRTWVVVGAFSGSVHFLDADTGERLLPDFPTGDIIKGSVTIDPDGYPLVYVGSRDNKYRVVAFERRDAPGAVVAGRLRPGPDRLERRLGQLGHGDRRPPVHRRRELAVPHREAEPRLRRQPGW